MIRPPSLYIFTKNEIEAMIVAEELKAGDRLPSEKELAKKYDVSRMTLREALRALEHEGLLVKRQGLGTFVKTTAPRIKSILDVNYGVTDMIRNMGFHPGTKEKNVKQVSADSALVQVFGCPAGSKVIIIERVRTADKRPVVYSLDILPAAILSDLDDLKDLGESVYDFLETRCNVRLSSSTAKLFPAKANRKLAAKLQIKMNSPMFYMEQIDTDLIGKPVLYSREYFVSEYFDFVVYRKRKK